ncbi:hypothetical protein [Pantoea sp. y20]
MSTSDLIAFGALAVSIYTVIASEIKSRKNDKEQRVIKDEQDRLRKLILEKETKSAISEMKAELGARIVNPSSNRYRLKIYNRGKVEARNIDVHFPDNDGDEYLIMSEVKDKFPYELLRPQQAVEMIASISFGSKTKYRIKITWDDDYQKGNVGDFYLSI